MNLIKFYQDVISWNSFVGNDNKNKNLIKLYTNLTIEESTEIFDSIKDSDCVEFIDGVCDILVVGSFLLSVKNTFDYSTHIVSQKEVNLKESLAKLKLLMRKDKLEELNQLKNDNPEISFEKEEAALYDLIVADIEDIITLTENISYSSKLDVGSACEEVMISNWSKFPLVESVDPEQEVETIEKAGRYSNISYSIKLDDKGFDRYIFKDGNGKVVKPSTFQEPRLEQFANEDFKELFFEIV